MPNMHAYYAWCLGTGVILLSTRMLVRQVVPHQACVSFAISQFWDGWQGVFMCSLAFSFVTRKQVLKLLTMYCAKFFYSYLHDVLPLPDLLFVQYIKLFGFILYIHSSIYYLGVFVWGPCNFMEE